MATVSVAAAAAVIVLVIVVGIVFVLVIAIVIVIVILFHARAHVWFTCHVLQPPYLVVGPSLLLDICWQRIPAPC